MNSLLVGAGAFGFFTSAMHIFSGQITLIRPFLKTDLANEIKGCLLVCWHMVSAFLLVTSCLFLIAGLQQPTALHMLVQAMAGSYILFAAMFIAVGWFFFGYQVLYKLPQWILLLPVGVLGLLGAAAL